MSWLRRMFGGTQGAPEAERRRPARVTIPAHGRDVVRIAELDMVGQRSASPNGRYTLVWHDRRWNDGVPEPGRYVLLDGDRIAMDAGMERPQDGKVADNGTFVLNDWGDSQSLSGTFRAFRSDGSLIVSRFFSANLLNNGLSADGRLAVCQTAHAPESPDSSILTVFDLPAGETIASWTVESGWATAYEFPEEGNRIRMVRGERPALDYSLTGEFLDRELWLRDEVARGTLYVIRKALAEGEAATGLPLDDLRAGVRLALSEADMWYQAQAWRLLGEIEESAGDPVAALDAYDRALSADPKVGVARRAAAIRKRLVS